MVDALHDAWRVLRPRGALIDVRPAAVYHPQLALRRGRRHLRIGPLRRDADTDVVAAQRASARVVRERLFTPILRVRRRWTSRYPTIDDLEWMISVSTNWHMPATTRRRLKRSWRPGDELEVTRAFTVAALRRRAAA